MDINGPRNNGNFWYFMLTKAASQEMVVHCRNHLPFEACGLISGVEGKGLRVWELKNESKNLNRFSISGESIRQAVKKMGKYAEQPVGIFHSHPNTLAVPSFRDIQNNPYTHLAYLIVSFYKGKVELGCFKTDGKKAIPLKLIIIDG